MIADSELKLNKEYWAVICDKELGELCGKDIRVKFTGIAFRNMEYKLPEFGDFVNDEKEHARKKIFDNKPREKKDEILMLSQIKIFREVRKEDLFEGKV